MDLLAKYWMEKRAVWPFDLFKRVASGVPKQAPALSIGEKPTLRALPMRVRPGLPAAAQAAPAVPLVSTSPTLSAAVQTASSAPEPLLKETAKPIAARRDLLALTKGEVDRDLLHDVSSLRAVDPGVLRGGRLHAEALHKAMTREGIRPRMTAPPGTGWRLTQLIQQHPEYVRARQVAMSIPRVIRPKLSTWIKQAAFLEVTRRFGLRSW